MSQLRCELPAASKGLQAIRCEWLGCVVALLGALPKTAFALLDDLSTQRTKVLYLQGAP